MTKVFEILILSDSVVDRHRFDADPDPDPKFHFDANPYTDPTTNFTHVENLFFFTFSHSIAK
jgi:hypothetical protein